ncbi:MAG: hypothetical protein K9G62_00640 [Alphaproteobacteria bacterium]|nr:hypothetical protein [Alphaproteobacteria bacterium]
MFNSTHQSLFDSNGGRSPIQTFANRDKIIGAHISRVKFDNSLAHKFGGASVSEEKLPLPALKGREAFKNRIETLRENGFTQS